MPLELNSIAPDFTLPSTDGRAFSLEADAKGKALIIYFYPKDFTTGCTAEACEFRDSHSVFKDLDIPVYGISKDNIESHLKFREAYKLPFSLLSDETGKVAKLYKASVPILGITRRISYLLDKRHRIAGIYENFFNGTAHIKEMINSINSI
ncbi:MAG: peroxiredoxin [Bacteroidota bacterium]